MLWDFNRNMVPVIHYTGYSDKLIAEYKSQYFGIDPGSVVLHGQPNIVVFNDVTLGTTAEVKQKHEFYDWLYRAGDQRHAFGARLFTGKGYESILLIARSGKQDEADRRDMERLSLFVPHLRRSISLARNLGARFSTEAFNALPFGVVILNESGHVSLANKAMEKIASERDGIELTRNGLRLSVPDEDADYRRMIERLRRGILLDTASARIAIAASRPSGKRPYSVLACPCPRPQTIMPEFNNAILVCVSDPSHVGHLREETLMALFGLSPAESRLTNSLVEYGSLAAAAVKCGLTEGTARQYIKRVFQKTGTGSQVELVALILGSVRI